MGTKTMGNFHTFTRSQWIKTNNTIDVPGAQPSTLKKCPTTNRNTNPLNPQYSYPGQSELGPNYMSNAFGEGPVSSLDPRYGKTLPASNKPVKALPADGVVTDIGGEFVQNENKENNS